MINSLDLLRYYNTSFSNSSSSNTVTSATQAQKALEKIKDDLSVKKEEGKSFESYLIDAVSYVNDTQNKSTALFEQAVIDPDSVDAHDVTIAMAQANLSLSLAQGVIDRMIRGWSEITTTR